MATTKNHEFYMGIMHYLWQSHLEKEPQTHQEMPFGKNLYYWEIGLILRGVGFHELMVSWNWKIIGM